MKVSVTIDGLKKKYATGGMLGSGFIPDGYNGNYTHVSFGFNQESGKTICFHSAGCFTYHIPPASDAREAFWLLQHHPTAKILFLQEE